MWESLQSLLFYLFAAIACTGAISVVISQNVVRMALGLIASLSSVSALFFLLSADFVGATQLMVYVGGTIVLVIFGVMLTSNSSLLKIKTSPADGVMAAGIALIFLVMIAYTVGSVGDWKGAANPLSEGYNATSEGNTLRPLALSFVGLRPDSPDKSGFLLPFEIVSVHLLVVLIGAAYLARSKRRVTGKPDQS